MASGKTGLTREPILEYRAGPKAHEATYEAKQAASFTGPIIPSSVSWGQQHAAGLSVASKLGGVNVNLLAADGPENVEALSGMAQLTGIRVAVEPAAGPVRRCRKLVGPRRGLKRACQRENAGSLERAAWGIEAVSAEFLL